MAFDAFLKLDGIDGSSTDKVHRDEIDILSFAWDVRAGSSGAPRLAELVVTKTVDRASATLLQHICGTNLIASGRLTVRKVGTESFDFLKIDFTNASISRIAPVGDAGSTIPVEQLGLKLGDVVITVVEQRLDGRPGDQIQTTC